MKLKLLLLCCLVAVSVSNLNAAGPHTKRHSSGTKGTPRMTHMDLNNISTVLWNDGTMDIDEAQTNSGFRFPKETRKTTVYESGFLWGGMVSGDIRVGGSAYRTGLQPGKILPGGGAEDPNLPKNRIYRVRPDYKTASLAAEAADEGIPESDVRAHYGTDWDEWPVVDGAPFTDINHNGTYDPDTDIPGVPGAGQTIWYVCNDHDSNLTNSLYGSSPMGLELQVTAWAYDGPGAMANMYFKKYTLINKGTDTIDSMYVSQWVDPDVGSSTDDFAGCDTTLDFSYAYNSANSDEVYSPLPPPAIGFAQLQGPAVSSPGDFAVVGGRYVAGKKNLRTNASYFFMRGDASVTDPTMASSDGAKQFYNFFRGVIGLSGEPYHDPLTGAATTFPLAGDPVTQTGWVGGLVFPASDVRIGIASGPFTMAVGDSQEVIYAEVAAGATPGIDNRSAITLLREEIKTARAYARKIFTVLPPAVQVTLHQGSINDAEAVISAHSDPGLKPILAEIRKKNGALIATDTLFDDGAHGDGGASDGIFANTLTLPRDPSPYSVTLTVTEANNTESRWENITSVTTVGLIAITGPIVYADNINADGVVNPGERIYFGALVHNNTSATLTGLRVTMYGNAGLVVAYPQVASGAIDSVSYVRDNPRTYFTLDVPAGLANTMLAVPWSAADTNGNFWADTLQVEVLPFGHPVYTTPIVHTQGSGTGAFEISVVNTAAIKNHKYIIKGVDSIDTERNPGFTLTDWNTGIDLLKNWPLPDQYGLNIPVTDGFKVRIGTIVSRGGMKDWAVPAGSRRWTWANAGDFALSGFVGAIGTGSEWLNASTIPDNDCHTILIKFAGTDSISGVMTDPMDTNASFGYRYLRHALDTPAQPSFAAHIFHLGSGYAWQDYAKTVPFAAYDQESNQRLAVGFLENNVEFGKVDGIYFPPSSDESVANTAGNGGREFFFIFAKHYTGGVADPSLEVDMLNTTQPLMWWGTPARRGQAYFHAGDEFEIIAQHKPAPSDRWEFNPTVLGVKDAAIPTTYSLSQNYPNPFNPTTTIRCTLPSNSFVTLKVYNLLGQEITRLVSGVQPEGMVTVQWDGTTRSGALAASGVYFYRLDATSLADPGKHFTQTMKMLLVR